MPLDTRTLLLCGLLTGISSVIAVARQADPPIDAARLHVRLNSSDLTAAQNTPMARLEPMQVQVLGRAGTPDPLLGTPVSFRTPATERPPRGRVSRLALRNTSGAGQLPRMRD
jgi:hypothetical protein